MSAWPVPDEPARFPEIGGNYWVGATRGLTELLRDPPSGHRGDLSCPFTGFRDLVSGCGGEWR